MTILTLTLQRAFAALGVIPLAACAFFQSVALAGSMPTTTTIPSPNQADFPAFGFSTANPHPLWTQLPEGSPGMAARWGLLDRQSGQPQALLQIELEPLEQQTVEDYCKKFQDKFSASMSTESTTLDGIAATRIKATKVSQRLQPIEAILAGHDGFAYVISLRADPALADARVEVDAFRETWKWKPFAAPLTEIETLREPFPFLDKFMLRVPRAMRPFPSKDRTTKMHLGIVDFAQHRTAFSCHIDSMARPGPVTPEVLARIAETLTHNFGAQAKIQWSELPGQPSRWLTTPFDVARDRLPSDPPSCGMVGMVDAGDTIANFTMIWPVTDDADKRKCVAACEAIMQSIQPITPGAKAR